VNKLRCRNVYCKADVGRYQQTDRFRYTCATRRKNDELCGEESLLVMCRWLCLHELYAVFCSRWNCSCWLCTCRPAAGQTSSLVHSHIITHTLRCSLDCLLPSRVVDDFVAVNQEWILVVSVGMPWSWPWWTDTAVRCHEWCWLVPARGDACGRFSERALSRCRVVGRSLHVCCHTQQLLRWSVVSVGDENT